MPGIHFDITGDNSNIVNIVNDTTERFKTMADNMKQLSQTFDFSDAQSAVDALKHAILDNEKVINNFKEQLQDLFEKQKEAASAGDEAAVQKYGEEMQKLAKYLQETTSENNQLVEALGTLDSAYDETSGKMSESSGIMEKLLGGTKNYNDIISNLPGPLKNAVSGLNGMVKAAKAFIATPLGAVLAALILAYKTITTWLNKSAEGQQALAKISGYLKGVLAGLQQVVMDVGKALYNAFTNPKQAIQSLWQTLKNELLNRIQAAGGVFVNFGKILGNAFKGNFKEAGEAAKAMANDYQKVFTGRDVEQIKEGTKALGDRIAKIHETGKAQSELSARENQLHRDRTAWMNEEAELDKEIAEQRNKMRMGSKSDRAEASKRLQELVDKKTEKNVALAREEYEIKKASNALTDSSQEDLDEEERLRARVVQLETQGITQKGFALRIQDSMNRSLGATSGKISEIIEKEKEFLESLQEQYDTVQRESASLAVGFMEEGFEKEMAEFELEKEQRNAALENEHKERINKIKEMQKAEYKARNGSLNGFAFNALSDAAISENAIYNQQRQNIDAQNELALKAIYKKYTDEYAGFIDKWEELTKKYNDDLTALTLSGALVDNPRIFDTFNTMRNDAFANLAKQWASSGQDSEFKRWFEGLGQQSMVELDVMLSDLLFDLEQFGDELPTDEVAKLNAKIALTKKMLKEGDFDAAGNAIADSSKKALVSWTDLNKVLTDTAKLFEQAGNVIGGVFGETLKMAGKFTTSIVQAGNALKAFEEARKIKDTVGMLTASTTAAGAAIAIASEVASKIKEAKERTEEVDAATKAYLRTLKQIQDSGLLSGFENAFGTNSYGQFVKNLDIAKQATEGIAAVSKTVKGETANIKNWGKALLTGPFALTTVFGTAVSKGNKVTADFVSDMRTGWQKFWGSDKNIVTASMSDFFDANGNLLGEKLQEWYSTYGEGLSSANRQIIEDMLADFDRLTEAKSNIKSYLSGLFGDVAGDMASDMVDNFVETGDAIKDMSGYMADFAKNVAKSIVQGKLMEKVFGDDAQDAIADLLAQGKTSEAINAYNELMERARSLGPEINSFLAGIDLQSLASSSDRTGLSQGKATASQDSIDALTGMMTVVQAHTFEIKESLTGFSAQYETLIANTAAMLEHTQGIHVDTTEIKEIQAEIAELSRSIRTNVSTMVDRGVKMIG